MCGTGGKSTPFHHSIPTPASASGSANGCRRSSRSPHGVATTAVTTSSTNTADSMNQNRQSGPRRACPNAQLSRAIVDHAYCPMSRCAPTMTTSAGAAMRRTAVSRPRTRSVRGASPSRKRARFQPTSTSRAWAVPWSVKTWAWVPTMSTMASARSTTLVSTERVDRARRRRARRVGGVPSGAGWAMPDAARPGSVVASASSASSSRRVSRCQLAGRCPRWSSTCSDASTYDSESPPREAKESSGEADASPSTAAYRSRREPAAAGASVVTSAARTRAAAARSVSVA
jgi:hypothetical protein